MTATSDTNEMTEYTDINPTPASEDIQPGDRVTYRYPDWPEAGELTAVAYVIPDFLEGVRLGMHRLGEARLHVLRVERPVPALPTRPWALVVPKRWDYGPAYLFHGPEWTNEVGVHVPTRAVRAALAEGTHYVAFEGVES